MPHRTLQITFMIQKALHVAQALKTALIKSRKENETWTLMKS